MAKTESEVELLLTEAITLGISPLTAARSLRHITRAELGQIAGLRASEVAELETGVMPIHLHAARLAKVLQVPSAVLIAWS